MSLDVTRLDVTRIVELLDGLDDDLGVLSFYVGITPSDRTNPQPPWRIAIKNGIAELRRRVREDEPQHRCNAVHARLDALDADIASLVDPAGPGRGRALFVTVGEGRTERLDLQVPFAERVLWRHKAYVRPLVAAWDEGRAAGIVVAHRGGTRLLEWRMGAASELASEAFEFGDAQLAGRKTGPSANNPQRAGQGLTHRERFEDRLDHNRRRFLRSALKGYRDQAASRGWDRLVVAGETRMRQWTLEELGAAGGTCPTLVEADQLWDDTSPHEIADSIWPTLRSLHRDRERALVAQARDGALAGAAGALGPGDVVAALNQGRVAHLLFATDLELTGWRDPDTGLLAAEGDGAAVGGGALEEEPHLVERMLERALGSGAAVTPVDEDAAEDLAGDGGMAAVLRW